jgi:hypothetical protein
MEKIDKGIGVLEKALNMVEKYKIVTILKGCFIVLIIAGLIGFLNNPTYIFEQYEAWKAKQHQTQMDIRTINNHKIQHLIEKSLYKIGAKRIIILEMHNGNSGMGGLPFNKCSATFEFMDDGIIPVAAQYQEQQLSLIPFANYLFNNGYFCGNIKDLEQYDRGLYHRMSANGTKHFAACVIKGVDKPLAFLFVSFGDLDMNHSCEIVREQIRHISLEIALCLELNRR